MSLTPQVVEKIEKLRNSIFALHEYQNFANSVIVSGLLIMKPNKFPVGGTTMMTFMLFQINQRKYETYRCQTFANNVMEELEKVDSVCLVNALGRLYYGSGGYLIQIEEIKITSSYPDIKLEPPYKVEKKYGKNHN